MNLTPVAIERSNRDIIITWSDDSKRRYSPSQLRKACPCALCKEKQSEPTIPTKPFALPVISMAEAQPLEVARMQPVGNYAYNIHFSDGHTSGIFGFTLLEEIGSVESSTS